MIQITETEEKVYLSFKKHHDINKVCKDVHLSTDTVRRYLKSLCNVGLMRQEKQRANYKVLDGQYEIAGKVIEAPSEPLLHFNKVPMTSYEKDWMLTNYKPRKRGWAAEVLGRTRSDICAMAMTLQIDMDGRWNNAKSDKGRSA